MSQTTPPDSKIDSPVRSRRELIAWRNAVFAIFFLSGLSIASWVARIPAVRDDTGLTLGGIGLVIFGMSAGSVLGLIAAPWVLARIGARRGMVSALFLVAIGVVIVGLGSTVLAAPAVIFFGMAMFGFGNGACDVMMNVEGALAERENGKTAHAAHARLLQLRHRRRCRHRRPRLRPRRAGRLAPPRDRGAHHRRRPRGRSGSSRYRESAGDSPGRAAARAVARAHAPLAGRVERHPSHLHRRDHARDVVRRGQRQRLAGPRDRRRSRLRQHHGRPRLRPVRDGDDRRAA